MNKLNQQKNKGFTLIEILVVVAIVGVLSTIVLSSLNSARAKSRDAQRLSNVNQLKNAFNLYFADNGRFPVISGPRCIGLTDSERCWEGYTINAGGNGFDGNTALMTALSPYITELPVDPSSNRDVGDAYLYSTSSLTWHCTNPNPPMTGPYIVWEPENTRPNTDKMCGPGAWACCGPLPCGQIGGVTGYFCALKL